MAGLFTYMVLLSIALGIGFAYVSDILVSLDPELEHMENYRPKQVTRVLDKDGNLVGELFEEKRELVAYSDIPRQLIEALVATEDKNYFHHHGIDPEGILRAAWVDLKAGNLKEGGSTLTQQLAKDMILSSSKTIERKLREVFLALRINQRFTKEETLEIYLNQVEFGHNIRGIGAAAQFYFGERVSELSLEECATLVGLLKAPTKYSPIKNPKRSVERMRVVLSRMAAEGYLSQREEQRVRDSTLRLAGAREAVRRVVNNPYFMDYVSRDLADPGMFGSRKSPGTLTAQNHLTFDDIREQGYIVRTTLDPRLQETCEHALRAGVISLEQTRRKHPWTWGDTDPEPWPASLSEGAVLDAVIDGSSQTSLSVTLAMNGAKVAVAADADQPARRWMTEYGVLGKGYHVRVVAHRLPAKQPTTGLAYRFTLMDEPHVQGAVVIMDVATGKVLALVGGTSYAESNFIRASQARRQPGSAFKPIEYTAALEQREKWLAAAVAAESQGLPEPDVYGFTPMSRLYDKYMEFKVGDKKWIPRNYHNDYWDEVTVRFALEKSLNVASIDLMMRFAGAWPRGVRLTGDMARRLGIDSPIGDNLSVTLGTSECTPLELCTAYATLANGGVLNRPWVVEQITRLDGLQVYQYAAAPSIAVSAQTAFLITRLMQNVVENGTAVRAGRELGHNFAGKTGTTSEFTDAWFAGYGSGLCCVVYLGLDAKKSLGRGMEGAQAALPVWIDIMRRARELYPSQFREFQVPDKLVKLAVCASSGRLPVAECYEDRSVIEEYFLLGTAPYQYCDRHAVAPMEPVAPPSLVALLAEAQPGRPGAASNRRIRNLGTPAARAPRIDPRRDDWWHVPLLRLNSGDALAPEPDAWEPMSLRMHSGDPAAPGADAFQ